MRLGIDSERMCRPKATTVVSLADRDIVSRDGLAVVECSWARIEDVPFYKIASPHERLCAFTNLLPSVIFKSIAFHL